MNSGTLVWEVKTSGSSTLVPSHRMHSYRRHLNIPMGEKSNQVGHIPTAWEHHRNPPSALQNFYQIQSERQECNQVLAVTAGQDSGHVQFGLTHQQQLQY